MRAAADAARAGGSGQWYRQFTLRESDILKWHPVFAMHAQLNIGIPSGLHFFEPRYRMLVQRALASDGKFVFAVSQPQIGSVAYLCELHNVMVYADGRADVHALPVSECRLTATQFEQMAGGNHLPLLWCRAEALPLPSRTHVENVRNTRRFLIRAGQVAAGGGGEATDDDADDEPNDEDEPDLDDEDDEDEAIEPEGNDGGATGDAMLGGSMGDDDSLELERNAREDSDEAEDNDANRH